jgi:hypothetical protein
MVFLFGLLISGFVGSPEEGNQSFPFSCWRFNESLGRSIITVIVHYNQVGGGFAPSYLFIFPHQSLETTELAGGSAQALTWPVKTM